MTDRLANEAVIAIPIWIEYTLTRWGIGCGVRGVVHANENRYIQNWGRRSSSSREYQDLNKVARDLRTLAQKHILC